MEDEWHGDVPVARIAGEVDASNVDDVRNRLRSLLTNRSVSLVVDLSATSYLDSAGIVLSLGNRLIRRASMPTRRDIALWDKTFIPLSRVLDPLFAYRLGKSLLEVRRKA